jgi:chromosome segregation ATPase
MAAVELATGYVSIVPSTKGIKAALEDALGKPIEAQAKKSAATFEQALAKQGNKLAATGGQLSRKLSLPLAAGFGFAIKAASDLNETTSKTTVVFGQASGEVLEFGRNASKSIGQSNNAALAAASGFGNLFKSIGLTDQVSAKYSVQLTKLAGDLASFQNTSPEEAVQALSSALVGEAEPIRRYGVLLDDASLKQAALDQGLGDYTKGTLPPAIRAQAAFGLIMKQTTTAQGDFARTSKGLANQSRILRAELEDQAAAIGTKLLPAALTVTKGVGGAVGAFGQLPPAVQAGTIALGGLAVAAGPVLSVVGNVEKGVAKLSPGFKSMGSTGAANFAIVAAAIAVVEKQLGDAKRKADALVANANKGVDPNDIASMQKALDQSSRDFDEAEAHLQGYNHGIKAVGGAIASVVEVFTPFTENTLTNNAAALAAASDNTRLWAERIDRVRPTLKHLAEDLEISEADVLRLAKANGIDLAGGYAEVANAVSNVLVAQRGSTSATRALAAASETLGSNVADAKEKVTAFQAALDASVNPMLRLRDAERGLQDAQKTLADLQSRGKVDAEAVASAEANVERTTRSLTTARRGLADIESEIARLRAGPSADEAGDADRAVRHADLDLERANKRLAAARDAARHAAAGSEAEQAALDLREAELGLADAIDSQQGARRDQQALLARGKQGSKELTDAIQREKDAQQQVKDAEAERVQAQADARTARAGDIDFEKNLAAALDAVVQQTEDYTTAQIEAGQIDAAAGPAALYEQVLKLRDKIPGLTVEIEKYAAALAKVPGAVQSQPTNDDATYYRRHAFGGRMLAGETAIVGEAGEEIVTAGTQSTVIPAARANTYARHMWDATSGSGSSVAVHVAAPVDAQTAAQIEQGARTASWLLGRDGLA